MNISPLKLTPDFKEKIWGGNRLSALYPLCRDGRRYGEAWVLTSGCREIGEFVRKFGMEALCGPEYAGRGASDFPLLVKLIDAGDDLSVQVHPDIERARKYAGAKEKNEMWYILCAEQGASIVCGTDCDCEGLRYAINEGSIGEHLVTYNVSAGDVIFIPAGLVHSIGKGILLFEVQQNSDTTFRLYDYGRKEEFGKERQLHTEQALECIKPKAEAAISRAENSETGFVSLCESRYFSVRRLRLCAGESYRFDGGKMRHLFCLSGLFRVSDTDMGAYSSYLIPYVMGDFSVFCESDCEIIVTEV